MEGFLAEFLLDPKVPKIIRYAVLAMGTAAAVKIHRNEKKG